MQEKRSMFKPQINISYPSTVRMWIVSFCAFFCVLQSSIHDGGKSMIIAVTSFFVALTLEFIFTWQKHGVKKILDGSAAATALILAMMLPNQIHPVYAALGSAFAIVVVKYSFGGLGANWLNPALGGWLFIRFSWTSSFSNALGTQTDAAVEVAEQGVSNLSVSEMVSAEISTIDNSVTDFFNGSVFSIFGVQMPSGYIDLLFYNSSPIITDRGLFALLIGTILITAAGINRGWIPLVFIAVYGFLIRFAGDLSDVFWNGDLLYGIFSGGTIAAAFILAAEPSSSAKFKPGIIFSVVLAAVLSWFFRYKCMEYSGCFIALALVNCLTPVIRLVEEKIFLFRNKQALTNRTKLQENLL
ncbi:MAG: RnfABCDGE type electron transport complex subunit D [Treponema sp.]|nr:RnfABCDGE type electron transport complex subunit D [Treponema sp.]